MNTTSAPAAITPDKFARIVNALSVQFVAGMMVGAEWPFMVAYGVEVVAWVPRHAHLTLQIREIDGPVMRTVTVAPGIERAYDVIASDGLLIGETRTAEGAFSIALDHLGAALAPKAQAQPDAFAV